MQPAMWRRALTLRLLALAILWSVLVLVIAGLTLTAAYRETAEADFAKRLQSSLLNLISQADFQGDTISVAEPALADPQFRSALSGWYWQIEYTTTGEVIARSPSLAGETLRMPDTKDVPLSDEFTRRAVIPDPRGELVSAVEQRLVVGEPGTDVTFILTGSRTDLTAGIDDFRSQIVLYLSIFGIGLIAITMILGALAVRPLRRMRAALQEVVSGDRDRLEGDFPAEVTPLVNEINGLISANRRTVERARTHAGNLAHALKTPLTVLRNEAGKRDDSLASQVREQTATMEQQISYHLDRARMAANSRVIGVATPVRPVLESFERAMQRIHADKGITFKVKCSNTVRFRGEKQDLEEILGNLIDNAFKWAKKRVNVKVTVEPGENHFVLAVDDDGPGVPPEEREFVFQRGNRLDEATPGSGLGLAIVDELVTLYGGALVLLESPRGGLRVRLRLPRAGN
ncbi:ATP-binding protein [Tepidamorphus sp. 3E244]|uniref:ATP-binding protein n=1 Tax=Tepidamorphus sp. 3E244 TaxID=3385498 RepID=UPI0038FD1F58